MHESLGPEREPLFKHMERTSMALAFFLIVAGASLLAILFAQADQASVDDSKALFDMGTYANTEYSVNHVQLNAAGLASKTGTYTSRVHDVGKGVFWNQLGWLPLSPYGKALPNDNAAESGYPEGNMDMTANRLLYHFEEEHYGGFAEEVEDGSASGNHGYGIGDVSTTDVGSKLGRSASFDGSGDAIIVLDDTSLEFTNKISVVGWFYFDGDIKNGRLIEKGAGGTSDWEYRLLTLDGVFGFNDAPIFQMSNNGSAVGLQVTANNALASFKNTWVFIAATYNGSTLKLWVNNQLVASANGAVTMFNGPGNVGIGSDGTGQFGFDGMMDELAVFGRGLSDTEVADLYKRGAHALQFQVRSCDDPVCAGESFIGPDGTGGTYFSETENSSLGPPMFAMGANGRNRYFQYQAQFNTLDQTLSPELRSATLMYGDTSSNEVEQLFPADLAVDINDGAVCATTPAVQVRLKAKDADEIIIANEPNFLNRTWMSFDTTTVVPWTLSPGDGIKTVYTIFRSPTDNKSVLQYDQIMLDEANRCGAGPAEPPAVGGGEPEEVPVPEGPPVAHQPLYAKCGNGVCDAGETVQSCTVDCRVETPTVPIVITPPPVPPPVCVPAEAFTYYLFPGLISASVRELQLVLQCLGHFPSDRSTTGFYGSTTIDAVEAFQKSVGLNPIGVVGPETRQALNALLKK